MQRDLAYLKDMLEAARKVGAFVEGFTWDQFLNDERTHLAVVRLIEIIGEAASKVSVEFKSAHAEIPWRDMIDMRNRLIHGYRDVRLDVVWRVTSESIPALIVQLGSLLSSDEG